MENATQPTAPVSQAPTMQYAGFWIRLLATVIDGVILGILGRLIFGAEVTGMNNGGVYVQYDGWRFLVPLLYTLVFWIWLSATPGKLICQIKIVNADGSKLTWQKAILRYIGYYVSAVGLFIGFLWVAFDAKKQGWHDKIAKTLVVKK